MKNVQKLKEKKHKTKSNILDKSKNSQVLVVAQEIRLARLLSGNEKKTRDKVLKTLKKWLSSCFEKEYDFKEDDFTRVWKGLFYAVWMSDKPLVQEDLCESIAGILDQFPPEQIKHAILMTKAGFKVLAKEWYGIDHHRMDKFLMLVRRYLRGSLRCLSRCKWSLDSCKLYAKMLSSKDGLLATSTPYYARNAASMVMHIVDCFLEELAKVSKAELPEDSIVELLRPFCVYMCAGESPTLCMATRRLLTALIRQSDKGLEYQEAKRAWEQMGCPEGGPEALELIEEEDNDQIMENGHQDSDEELDSSEKPLDPRAGRVDVVLPSLPVPASRLAVLLKQLLANATSKAHKRVKICLQRFEKLAQDEYPLPLEQPKEEESDSMTVNKLKAAQELHALEKKLVNSSDELALRGLSRKHRKRLLAKTRAGLSIVDDVENIQKTSSKVSTNGDWHVEPTEPKPKKAKLDDTSNKENQHKKSKHNKNDTKKENNNVEMNGVTSKKPKVLRKDNIKEKKDNHNTQNKGVVSKVARDHKTSKENNLELKEKKKDSSIKDLNKLIDEKIADTKNKKVIPVTYKQISTNSSENKLLKTHKPNGVDFRSSKKVPSLTVNKVKKFQKSTLSEKKLDSTSYNTPKRVKFVLKNNSMQRTVDYYKSVRQSPSIPFDSAKKPSKTNLKPSTPSPINPFFKKKQKKNMFS